MVLTHHSKVHLPLHGEVLGASGRSLMVGCVPIWQFRHHFQCWWRSHVTSHCPCSLTLTWHLPQCWSQDPHGLRINVEPQIVTRLQAELLLHSIIPEFPGPNASQRKGSSICALANAQMQAQMAAPTLPYLLPVLFTVPKPSPESDAEHVFTGCVQGLELLFQHRDGMEGQSLVLIANLNSWGFLAPAPAHLPLNMKQGHGMAACQRILTPVHHIVLD